jgi:hypothetical protein
LLFTLLILIYTYCNNSFCIFRDEVRRFDIKSKQLKHLLDEGIDVVLWQLNVNHGGTDGDTEDFAAKATPVTIKLAKRGELLVQTALLFGTRGGYLSKALGRGQYRAFFRLKNFPLPTD